MSTQHLDMPTMRDLGRYYHRPDVSVPFRNHLQGQYERIVESVGVVVGWFEVNAPGYMYNGHRVLHRAPGFSMLHGQEEQGLLLAHGDYSLQLGNRICQRTVGVFVGSSIFHRFDDYAPDGKGEKYIDMLPGGSTADLTGDQLNTLANGLEIVVPFLFQMDELDLPIHRSLAPVL